MKRKMRIAFTLLSLLLLSGGWTSARASEQISSVVQSLDSDHWLLLPDPKNEGREQHWFDAPQTGAKETKVPWIIQDVFPRYHGVAWYWRDFSVSQNPHVGGRWILRFWAVDYQAEVWLNGKAVGQHEGGEGMFELDVTGALRPGSSNRLTVRVLNPKNEPIDGYVLRETPARNKTMHYSGGASYNHGGIVDSVELLAVAPVRVENVFVRPDWKTGVIRIQANIRNAGKQKVTAAAQFAAAPAMSGETLVAVKAEREFPPGDSVVESELQVPDHRLWELNDPQLYRVSIRLQAQDSASVNEVSVRCGFRDFRFADGYFRLNGRRLFLRSSHTGNHSPVGLQFPTDPDLLRRDLFNVKVMGFNTVRFWSGVPTRQQLDLCDELGLMIYEESYASYGLAPSPFMAERFDRSLNEMIRRDRNHPCITMWGLLNESGNTAVFRHAVQSLPLVRNVDDTRVVMLNSGRFDGRTNRVQLQRLRGLETWKTKAGADPNVTHNPTNYTLIGAGTKWAPGQLAFHPGPAGEYSVVRWTSPVAGECEISAQFSSIAERATTDTHLLHNGKPLDSGFINLGGNGDRVVIKRKLMVAVGDQIDFVVGCGNGNYAGDSTAVAVAIKTPAGQTHVAGAEFSLKANPNGDWSYGTLAAAKTPDCATFQLYDTTEVASGNGEAIGSLSNPQSNEWEDVLADQHPYLPTPLAEVDIQSYRTMEGDDGKSLFISEYGVGSAVDLSRTVQHYQRIGKVNVEDAQNYQYRLNLFRADWKAWKMNEVFGRPEDFFAASQRKMAGERLMGTSAIRANPKVVGYSLSGAVDQGMSGEGLFTTWRELKPGTVDAMFDAWSPLRWCLFVNRANIYRGDQVRCEAVLANEDQLAPGDYPARVQVFGPDNGLVWEKQVSVRIPSRDMKPEPAFAINVLSESVSISGPPGCYRLVASFDYGAAPSGREAVFYVANRAEEPKFDGEVVLWGEDPKVAKWCADRGIRTRPFTSGQTAREIILLGTNPPLPAAAAFAELARHVARGSKAISISAEVFAEGKDSGRWLPLPKKGSLVSLGVSLYHKDEWARSHPVFNGLPTGMMDYVFYRDLIPGRAWNLPQPPDLVVCGANDTSLDYSSGVMLSAHDFGAGCFVLNTLQIRENLGQFPPADRLLLNLLQWAAHDIKKPLAETSASFDEQLKALKYQ